MSAQVQCQLRMMDCLLSSGHTTICKPEFGAMYNPSTLSVCLHLPCQPLNETHILIHSKSEPTKNKVGLSMLGWQVQAWPVPLSGAGLVQNLLQAAAEGKDVKKKVECIHLDEHRPLLEDNQIEKNAYTPQMQKVHPCD